MEVGPMGFISMALKVLFLTNLSVIQIIGLM